MKKITALLLVFCILLSLVLAGCNTAVDTASNTAPDASTNTPETQDGNKPESDNVVDDAPDADKIVDSEDDPSTDSEADSKETDTKAEDAAAEENPDIDGDVSYLTDGTESPDASPMEPEETSTNNPEISEQEEVTDEFGLTEQQRNSYSMLYFLAITAEEILNSKDNSLVLDDIYTSLFNDINPGAIDETTQSHLENLRNIIENYLDISTKKERLQYIYNQQKAASIRSAVPDPMSILSVVNSVDWTKMATSVVFTVVDSYNNYKASNDAADLEFLMNGWELEDEATEAMRKNRRRAFNYMVDIVQEYGLDGRLTLNEESIQNFAAICSIESIYEKIERLESEEETYQLLGNYWLELADCYFETSQYSECLSCVEMYKKLSTGIYRMDYNYVQILPKAIVALRRTSWGSSYVERAAAFADDILANTKKSEWSVRYFAAQTYLDLYAKTENADFLEKAYEIAYDNVTILLPEQRELNEAYLNDVEELSVEEPDYRYLTDAQKKEREKQYNAEVKRLKAYNKELLKARETELPPLYDALILNCDLLFALADKMDIGYTEKKRIKSILQTDSNGIFLSDAVNDRYSFVLGRNAYEIQFDRETIIVPANLLSTGAKVVVTITDGGKSTTIDDYTITKVKRGGETVETFACTFTSKDIKEYAWTAKSKIKVEIFNGDSYDPITFNYKVVEYKDNVIIADKVVFGLV